MTLCCRLDRNELPQRATQAEGGPSSARRSAVRTESRIHAEEIVSWLEAGNETWGDIPFEKRAHVGTWMVPSYDPTLDLMYIGLHTS